MSANGIIKFFEDYKARGAGLALATVIETAGSTYSKAGAQMLIDAEGRYRGMLSGGCLEGDLAIRARIVLESGQPQMVTYDLGQDDDAIWGLGVGCEGVMKVLLQPLGSDYEPFASVARILEGDTPGAVTIRLENAMPLDDGEFQEFQVDVRPPPNVLILGAGPDAVPLLQIACEQGWRCTVADHRPAYLANDAFEAAARSCCAPAEELAATIDLSRYAMAVVMSHHLLSDLAYLRQLAVTDIGYIGLLGPASRRDRLLRELGELAVTLRSRLEGPAGLDIGGRGAASIALSIVAQMHAHYYASV